MCHPNVGFNRRIFFKINIIKPPVMRQVCTYQHNISGFKGTDVVTDELGAFSFFKMGIYAESLELLSKTLPYYEQNNDTENIIKIYLNMVEVLNKGISERPKIISLMQKAIRLGKNLKKEIR